MFIAVHSGTDHKRRHARPCHSSTGLERRRPRRFLAGRPPRPQRRHRHPPRPQVRQRPAVLRAEELRLLLPEVRQRRGVRRRVRHHHPQPVAEPPHVNHRRRRQQVHQQVRPDRLRRPHRKLAARPAPRRPAHLGALAKVPPQRRPDVPRHNLDRLGRVHHLVRQLHHHPVPAFKNNAEVSSPACFSLVCLFLFFWRHRPPPTPRLQGASGRQPYSGRQVPRMRCSVEEPC